MLESNDGVYLTTIVGVYIEEKAGLVD